MTTSAEVRSHLIDALQLDLVGPTPDDAVHAEETLDQAPSKWYLTGFLVPYGVPVEQRTDNSGDEEMDEVGRVGSGEDEKIPEKAFARKELGRYRQPRTFRPRTGRFTVFPYRRR
ncbi:hypothetical protein [Nostoc sp.]